MSFNNNKHLPTPYSHPKRNLEMATVLIAVCICLFVAAYNNMNIMANNNLLKYNNNTLFELKALLLANNNAKDSSNGGNNINTSAAMMDCTTKNT